MTKSIPALKFRSLNIVKKISPKWCQVRKNKEIQFIYIYYLLIYSLLQFHKQQTEFIEDYIHITYVCMVSYNMIRHHFMSAHKCIYLYTSSKWSQIGVTLGAELWGFIAQLEEAREADAGPATGGKWLDYGLYCCQPLSASTYYMSHKLNIGKQLRSQQ